MIRKAGFPLYFFGRSYKLAHKNQSTHPTGPHYLKNTVVSIKVTAECLRLTASNFAGFYWRRGDFVSYKLLKVERRCCSCVSHIKIFVIKRQRQAGEAYIVTSDMTMAKNSVRAKTKQINFLFFRRCLQHFII